MVAEGGLKEYVYVVDFWNRMSQSGLVCGTRMEYGVVYWTVYTDMDVNGNPIHAFAVSVEGLLATWDPRAGLVYGNNGDHQPCIDEPHAAWVQRVCGEFGWLDSLKFHVNHPIAQLPGVI